MTKEQGFSLEFRARIRSVLVRLLGVSLTPGVRQFFMDLSIVAVCYIAARFLSAIANVMAARALGKANYGNVQLVITYAQLFGVPATLGLNTAVVRYAAGNPEPHYTTSTAFWTVGGATCLVAIACMLLASPLQGWFEVSPMLFTLGVLCGIAYSFTVIVGALQQAVVRYTLRGITEIVLSGTFLLAVGFVLVSGSKSFVAVSLAYLVSYILTVALGLWPIRRVVRPRDCQLEALKTMAPFATYCLICGVGFFLMSNMQKLILKPILSEAYVGIYGIYSQASLNLAVFAGSMIATVLFPRASASRNRADIWRLASRTLSWVWLPIFAGLAFAQVIVVLLSGSDYPLDMSIVLSFSLASCVIIAQTTLGQIIGAEGNRGARLGMITSITLGLMNLLLSFILIPLLQVSGAALALTISYGTGIVWLTLVRHQYLNDSSGRISN